MVDKFTLSGPYGLEVPFVTTPAVVVENLILRSKNGRVGRLKIGQLETTVKDKVLNLIVEQAEKVQTISGLQNWLTSGGSIVVEGDLFWLKAETKIYPFVAKKQTAEKKADRNFSELRELSEKT